MFAAFLLLWIIFNGKVTLEIVLVGCALSAALFAFCCKFMGYSIQLDRKVMRLLPMGFQYILVLIVEILKANRQVLYFISNPRCQVEPQIVHFKSNLRTKFARVVLANSITLTPGTITLVMMGKNFYVHCLDKEFAEGMENSVFVELLKKMEAVK